MSRSRSTTPGHPLGLAERRLGPAPHRAPERRDDRGARGPTGRRLAVPDAEGEGAHAGLVRAGRRLTSGSGRRCRRRAAMLVCPSVGRSSEPDPPERTSDHSLSPTRDATSRVLDAPRDHFGGAPTREKCVPESALTSRSPLVEIQVRLDQPRIAVASPRRARRQEELRCCPRKHRPPEFGKPPTLAGRGLFELFVDQYWWMRHLEDSGPPVAPEARGRWC
jgi:hypothetical protein